MRGFLFISVIFMIFISCDKQEVKGDLISQIEGKWDVDNSSSQISYEFSKAGYLISIYRILGVENISEVERILCYKYTVVDDNTIKLDNRLCTFDKIEKDKMTFTLTYFSGITEKITVRKVSKVMPYSLKTKLLCRSWYIDRIIDGDMTSIDVTGTNVCFSKYGSANYNTYFGNPISTNNLKNWKWSDAEQNAIEIVPVDKSREPQIIEIVTLAENELVLKENYSGSSVLITLKLGVNRPLVTGGI